MKMIRSVEKWLAFRRVESLVDEYTFPSGLWGETYFEGDPEYPFIYVQVHSEDSFQQQVYAPIQILKARYDLDILDDLKRMVDQFGSANHLD